MQPFGDRLAVLVPKSSRRFVAALMVIVVVAFGGSLRTVWPLLVPAVIVTASTLVSYGQTRLRVEAEPSLAVLASVTLVASYTAWRARPRRPATADAEPPTLQPT